MWFLYLVTHGAVPETAGRFYRRLREYAQVPERRPQLLQELFPLQAVRRVLGSAHLFRDPCLWADSGFPGTATSLTQPFPQLDVHRSSHLYGDMVNRGRPAYDCGVGVSDWHWLRRHADIVSILSELRRFVSLRRERRWEALRLQHAQMCGKTGEVSDFSAMKAKDAGAAVEEGKEDRRLARLESGTGAQMVTPVTSSSTSTSAAAKSSTTELGNEGDEDVRETYINGVWRRRAPTEGEWLRYARQGEAMQKQKRSVSVRSQREMRRQRESEGYVATQPPEATLFQPQTHAPLQLGQTAQGALDARGELHAQAPLERDTAALTGHAATELEQRLERLRLTVEHIPPPLHTTLQSSQLLARQSEFPAAETSPLVFPQSALSRAPLFPPAHPRVLNVSPYVDSSADIGASFDSDIPTLPLCVSLSPPAVMTLSSEEETPDSEEMWVGGMLRAQSEEWEKWEQDRRERLRMAEIPDVFEVPNRDINGQVRESYIKDEETFTTVNDRVFAIPGPFELEDTVEDDTVYEYTDDNDDVDDNSDDTDDDSDDEAEESDDGWDWSLAFDTNATNSLLATHAIVGPTGAADMHAAATSAAGVRAATSAAAAPNLYARLPPPPLPGHGADFSMNGPDVDATAVADRGRSWKSSSVRSQWQAKSSMTEQAAGKEDGGTNLSSLGADATSSGSPFKASVAGEEGKSDVESLCRGLAEMRADERARREPLSDEDDQD